MSHPPINAQPIAARAQLEGSSIRLRVGASRRDDGARVVRGEAVGPTATIVQSVLGLPESRGAWELLHGR